MHSQLSLTAKLYTGGDLGTSWWSCRKVTLHTLISQSGSVDKGLYVRYNLKKWNGVELALSFNCSSWLVQLKLQFSSSYLYLGNQSNGNSCRVLKGRLLLPLYLVLVSLELEYGRIGLNCRILLCQATRLRRRVQTVLFEGSYCVLSTVWLTAFRGKEMVVRYLCYYTEHKAWLVRQRCNRVNIYEDQPTVKQLWLT